MLTALALAAATASCTPVPGAKLLWQPATRWVVVGEQHGSNESPVAFANLVCLAAATGRPTTVALEYAANWQPVIDAWLTSDGGPEARARLLALPVWTDPMQDGRSSAAVLRLFEQLRQMKQAGTIQGAVASTPPWDESPPAGQNPGAWGNAVMAKNWTTIPAPKQGLVLVYVGNFHAMDKPPAELPFKPAAALLPRARTVTVNIVADGGQAWNCTARDDCKARDIDIPLHRKTEPIGISMTPQADKQWDANYRLGMPFTASAPAVSPVNDSRH